MTKSKKEEDKSKEEKFEEIRAKIRLNFKLLHKKEKELSVINERIRVLKEEKKKVCPHDNVKERSNGYFEEGRMSGPVSWNEKVCVRCGKVLEVQSETVVKKWNKAK